MVGELLVLGISGSPRTGNTEILVKEALNAVKEFTSNIITKYVSLSDLEINHCTGCFGCTANSKTDVYCTIFHDDMNKLYPLLEKCKGLIIGAPVYFGDLNSKMKAFIDRTEPFVRYGKSPHAGALRNKIGAGIANAYNRNGGIETTLMSIHHFFFIHDMIVVGTGPDLTPGCYLGGAGVTYPKRSINKKAVLDDELGIKSARIIGRRVAELCQMIYLR